jgi:hypothetical protein
LREKIFVSGKRFLQDFLSSGIKIPYEKSQLYKGSFKRLLNTALKAYRTAVVTTGRTGEGLKGSYCDYLKTIQKRTGNK